MKGVASGLRETITERYVQNVCMLICVFVCNAEAGKNIANVSCSVQLSTTGKEAGLAPLVAHDVQHTHKHCGTEIIATPQAPKATEMIGFTHNNS